MVTVWLLMFLNLTNHESVPVALFSGKAACLTTARTEWRAANQQGDTGRHFSCEAFAISSRLDSTASPLISKTCLLKYATKDVSLPDIGSK